MNTINALSFRQNFGETLDRVVRTGIPLVVERQNKPLVVMYPFSEKKEDLEKKQLEEKKKDLLKKLAYWRKKWGSLDIRDSTAIIRKMRDERYGKRWWKTRSHY